MTGLERDDLPLSSKSGEGDGFPPEVADRCVTGTVVLTKPLIQPTMTATGQPTEERRVSQEGILLQVGPEEHRFLVTHLNERRGVNHEQ